jgi:hypothetical protein
VNYGLQAYWKLDEASGTSAADASGSGNTGTLVNTPTWDPAGGVLNGSLAFNGSTSYVAVSVPAGSRLKYTGGEMTISAWVYVNSTESYGQLISRPWNSMGEINYELYYYNGAFCISGNIGQVSYDLETSAYVASPATWHHVAFTMDSTNLMKLYVDGTLLNSNYHTIANWNPVNGDYSQYYPLAIGAGFPYGSGWGGDASSFDGKLDDVRFYTHALSAESIAELARAPVAFWKFNESSQSTATDSSGNGNTGTLVNGPTWTNGYIDGALAFNGSNSYVSVPSNSALKYTGGEITIGAWIYVNLTETSGGDLISKPWNSLGDYNYRLGISASNCLFFSMGGNGASYNLQSSTPLPAGAWHHVAVTVQPGDATPLYVVTLYIDGNAVASAEHSIPNLNPLHGDYSQFYPLAIGTSFPYGSGWAGNATMSFGGKLDNVRFYDRALTQAAIQAMAIDPPLQPDGKSGRSVSAMPLSFVATTVKTAAIGDLGTYAIRVGDAVKWFSSVLADAMPSIRQLGAGSFLAADRVDAVLRSDKYPPLAKNLLAPARSRIDVVLAAIGVKGQSFPWNGDVKEGTESEQEWCMLRPQGLKRIKVLYAVDACMDDKSR